MKKILKMIIASNKNKLLFILILCIFLFMATFLLNTFPFYTLEDENVYIHIAEQLMRYGQLRAMLGGDALNLNKRTYCQLPVYPFLSALSLKFLGIGLAEARTASVVLGFVSIIFAYLIAKKLYNEKIALLATFLLSTENLFIVVSRTVRPEIAVATFALICSYLYIIASRRKSIFLFFLTGISMGLAMLSHIYALIFLVAICLLFFGEYRFYLFKEKFFWSFLIGLMLTLAPYIYYVSLDFQTFLRQLYYAHRPRFLFFTGSFWINTIKNEILRYSIYYFPRRLPIIFTFLFSTIWIIFHRFKSDRIIYVMLLVNMLLFILIRNKFCSYLTLIIPYFCIATARVFYELRHKKNIISKIAFSLLFIFILNNILGNILCFIKYRNADYLEFVSEIKKFFPKDAVVLGASIYWLGMREYKFYSHGMVFIYIEQGKSFAQLIEDINPNIILCDDIWKSDVMGSGLQYYTADELSVAAEKNEIKNFLKTKCKKIGEVIPQPLDFAYGKVEIYKVNSGNENVTDY